MLISHLFKMCLNKDINKGIVKESTHTHTYTELRNWNKEMLKGPKKALQKKGVATEV